MNIHEFYMNEALIEARKALKYDEVPIGAIIVRDGLIIARAHNMRETDKMATAHAEILAIEQACKKLGGWRLTRCQIYVTIEPCVMCAGAIYQARIDNLYYGAKDYKAGAFGSLYDLSKDQRLNHIVQAESNVLEEEASTLISSFFKNLRHKKSL